MKNITLKVIRKWFKDNDFDPRHDPKGIKYAVNELNKEVKVDALDLFLLLVANEPINELYTHSYGFNTSNGRYLRDTMQEYYYSYTNKN